MGKILIGTASWTDPQLIKAGTFYPSGVNDAESRLRYYAQNFPFVEVDSTYYALPSPMTAGLWADRTPKDFTFDVKAFRLFTNHPTDPRSLPRDLARSLPPLPDGKKYLYFKDVPEEIRDQIWARFKAALEPLEQSDKMGLVLLQFPPWFHPSTESKDHILLCVDKLKPLRSSVEFRSASWLNEHNREGTFGFLRDNKLPFVCVDEPPGFKSSVPPIAEVTADTALVRFHGRNQRTWEQRGVTAAERFNWYYKQSEFEEWVPKIITMSTLAKVVHVVMNTNFADQGIVNSRLLASMLPHADLPSSGNYKLWDE